MQWLPYGGPAADFNDHIRTFDAVFPEVTLVKGAGGYGVYMLGSSRPITFDPADIREVLGRPGHPRPTSRRPTTHRPRPSTRGWTRSRRQTWLTGDEAEQVAGDGPLITDDRPRTEYFLLRRLFGNGLP